MDVPDGLYPRFMGARKALYYGTNRRQEIRLSPNAFYGSERSEEIETGICQVSVPLEHVIGRLERPIFGLEVLEAPHEHFVLTQVVPLDAQAFGEKLRDAVKGESAFVFVHGFNTTFAAAARQTAQLAVDLALPVAPIFFSWPSRGKWRMYPSDEEAAQWSVDHLAEFLKIVRKASGETRIHLVAHSMGNRALMQALQSLLYYGRATTRPLFDQVILTAPDIDADQFKDLSKKIRSRLSRATMYASSKDKPLKYSRRFHDTPRAGESGSSLVVTPDVDTIDASSVDTSLNAIGRFWSLQHSYFRENRTVLGDIHNLFLAGQPPSLRFGMKAEEKDGLPYWMFRP